LTDKSLEKFPEHLLEMKFLENFCLSVTGNPFLTLEKINSLKESLKSLPHLNEFSVKV